MIDKQQINIKKSEISPNYEYCRVSYAGNQFDNIALNNVNVCVLPFETDDSGKAIVSVYLNKYYDFIKDSMRVSTLMYKHNEEKDETNLDTVMRCVRDTMKVPLHVGEINRVFYLGEIELNNLVSGAIPCYAVNVTGMTNNESGIYSISDEMQITLERVIYHTVLRGTSQDYLVASSIFMLLSYLS